MRTFFNRVTTKKNNHLNKKKQSIGKFGGSLKGETNVEKGNYGYGTEQWKSNKHNKLNNSLGFRFSSFGLFVWIVQHI
jgi:hypothetical protein